MKLEQLTQADFEQVFSIMEQSFPTAEMRKYEGQKKLLERKDYHLMGYKEGSKLVAFFAYWEILDYIYIDHFAVSPQKRGKGLGETLLKQFQTIFRGNIFLEVEPPENAVAKGRIAFYERMGFVLNSFSYFQPPMRTDTPSIPLMIMSTPKAIDKKGFSPIKKELFEKAYCFFEK